MLHGSVGGCITFGGEISSVCSAYSTEVQIQSWIGDALPSLSVIEDSLEESTCILNALPREAF
ncbi:MAG: hypothetical protein CMK42_06795 [Porticoccaceae bacterium]|nr:hypothetical protein [Porticoccaceae bacterium]